MPKKNKKQAVSHKGKTAVKHQENNLVSGAGIILVLLLFIVHPLMIGPQTYISIEEVKYTAFIVIFGCSLVSIGMAAIITYIQNPNYLKWSGFKPLLRAVRPYEYAMLGYWLMLLFSTVLSVNPEQSFFGSSSRGESFLLQTAYLVTAAISARLYTPKERDLLIFCIVASLVSAYGICMFYGFDFLNFNEAPQILDNTGLGLLFVSTMSNRVVAAIYICLAFCVSVVMFSQCKTRLRWAFLITGCISFYALLICRSRGGYAAVIFAVALCFPLIAKTRLCAARFLSIISACVALFWIYLISYDSFGYGEPPFGALMPFLPWITLLAAVISIVLARAPLPELPKMPMCAVWYILLVVALIAVLAILPMAAEATNNNTLLQASEMLKGNFDDTFGSNRIFVWKRSLILASERPIFGYGPDSFYSVFQDRYAEEAMAIEGSYFDKAHNEFLQVLVTMGVAGLAGLLAFYGTVFRGVRKKLNDPITLALSMAMLSFLAQSFFCFSTPITHPIVWCMWGILAGRSVKPDQI